MIDARPIRARRRTCPRHSTPRSEGAHSGQGQPRRRAHDPHPSAARRRRMSIVEFPRLPSRCDSTKEDGAPRAPAPLQLAHSRSCRRETPHALRPLWRRGAHRRPGVVAALRRNAPHARARRGSLPVVEAPTSVPSARAHSAQKRRARRTSPDTALSAPSVEAETVRAMDNTRRPATVQEKCASFGEAKTQTTERPDGVSTGDTPSATQVIWVLAMKQQGCSSRDPALNRSGRRRSPRWPAPTVW